MGITVASANFDAHVTTLLTAIILYVFGMGPIKGFATTQIIAVVLTCSAVSLSQDWYLSGGQIKGRHLNAYQTLKTIFKKAHFKFVEARKGAYGISVGVLVLGIGSFFYGFDEGVAYKGGRSYTIHFDQPQNESAIRDALHTPLGEFPVVKTVGSNRTLNITTSFQKENPSRTADSLVEMTANGLKLSLLKEHHIRNSKRNIYKVLKVYSLLFLKT